MILGTAIGWDSNSCVFDLVCYKFVKSIIFNKKILRFIQAGWLKKGDYYDAHIPDQDVARRKEEGIYLQSFLEELILNDPRQFYFEFI